MDQKQQADALSAAIGDAVPEIRETPKTHLELLRGVFNSETNSWETTAYVRELNGFDEEALATLNSRDVVYAEYMSFLLKRAVVNIGSFNIESNPTIIDNLIIGDRDLLFLKIVEATYGNDREYQVVCGACGASNDVIIPMDDFGNREVSHDPHQPIEVTIGDGSVISMRLPNGMDSQVVAKKAKSLAEQNTLMLSRCVEKPAMTKPQEWAKGLGMKDRNNLVNALLDSQPGPEIGEVDAQCATCNQDLNIVLDWASLLFG
jgi:hypothetical protein